MDLQLQLSLAYQSGISGLSSAEKTMIVAWLTKTSKYGHGNSRFGYLSSSLSVRYILLKIVSLYTYCYSVLIHLWENLAVDRPTYLKPGRSLLWLVKSSRMKRWHLQLGFSMYPAKYCHEITIKSDKTLLVYKYRSSNASNNWWSLRVKNRVGLRREF